MYTRLDSSASFEFKIFKVKLKGSVLSASVSVSSMGSDSTNSCLHPGRLTGQRPCGCDMQEWQSWQFEADGTTCYNTQSQVTIAGTDFDGLSSDLHLGGKLDLLNLNLNLNKFGFALGFRNLICTRDLNSRDMQLMYFATNLTCRIWMQVKIKRQKFVEQIDSQAKLEVCQGRFEDLEGEVSVRLARLTSLIQIWIQLGLD